MKKPWIWIGLATYVLITILACSTSTSKGTIVNPNGDKELALWMRKIFDESLAAKKSIKEGKTPKWAIPLDKIHTAQATEPDKVASPTFQVYAISFEQSFNALQKAAPEERETYYTAMVNSCMACHKALCPGPMVKIKRLYLDK